MKRSLCMIILVSAVAWAGQTIYLKTGDLTVSSGFATGSCVQVPIFINDPNGPTDLLDITFTLEITGDTGIIAGGITTDMVVANAFTGGSLNGITNPATNLTNYNSGTGAPACTTTFNQATEGQGPAVNFLGGNGNANWFINNNQGAVGRKQGFVINLIGQTIGTTVPNTDHLIGVLVIPIVTNPGTAQLVITPTPNNVVTDANVYTYEDGTDVQVVADFDLSQGQGVVNISGTSMSLSIGDLTVSPSSFPAGGCVQVPILINDPNGPTDLRDVTFTVEITGDTGIIAGGITTEMAVGNAFTAGSLSGITNPATNLTNNNSGTGTPTCTVTYNQATEGQGPAINFLAGNGNANWFINNNQGAVGRKQGFVINLAGLSIGSTAANTDHLLAVLVIPIIANPGNAQLIITPTSNSVVTDANVYSYDDGTEVLVSADLDLSTGPGFVNIIGVPDCSGVTITDNAGVPPKTRGPLGINYLDPMAGGVGGDLLFTMPNTSSVDQITVMGSDGFSTTIPSGGATTLLSINTQGDGSPSAAQSSIVYTITYEVEFPIKSGNFVGGVPCVETVAWNPATCNVVFDAMPVVGGNTNADVTLTNAVWDGTRFGLLTGPNALSVNLTAPSVSGLDLFFDNAAALMNLSASHVGTYNVSGSGPGVGNNIACSAVLGLQCPTNNVTCPTTLATLGGMVTVNLVGSDVLDWDITYNGVTTNVPGPTPTFDVGPIVASAMTITITANGVDAMGVPCSETVVCTLDYVAPTCDSVTQNPDSTVTPVDIGTVITLTLVSSGANQATINGVPMTPTVGMPGTDNTITWDATHVAVMDTVITALITGPDGDTAQCMWVIDVACVDPTFVVEPPIGQTGIAISGDDGCTYTVRVSPPGSPSFQFDMTVVAGGMATDNTVVVTPNTLYEVGQQSIPVVTDSFMTGAIPVPTLGTLGLILLTITLAIMALALNHRRKVAE
ncbi:MAG: hypothetical protein KDC35_07660 [Acidobacteria bacterium]|nr:hypothetical protein [Acidobacteriota bacterium]